MPVKVINTEFGHSIPPEGPHTVTFHTPSWEANLGLRAHDPAVMSKLRSVYPRFAPMFQIKELGDAIRQKLGLPEAYFVYVFVSPDVFPTTKRYVFSERRKEAKFGPRQLLLKVVDIAGIRVFCISCPATSIPGIFGVWQIVGTGVSTRLAAHLLENIDTLVEVPGAVDVEGDVSPKGGKVPPEIPLPEVPAHQGIRDRVTELLHRAPIDPAKVTVKSDDVYLYPTGMGALWRIHQAVTRTRKGTTVVLGAVFHNTWDLVDEELDQFKHFPECTAKGQVSEKLEEYLEEETKQGRKISYVLAEVPSNPLLVTVDVLRLKQLADKYGFYLVIDDTVGSFCNVDVLGQADVLVTSLTKSFSGYADVMAGSVVLNPQSPRYQALKDDISTNFQNEFFAPDAEKLFSNSADYLARSAILNRNGATVAALLQEYVADPTSPVSEVLYPPQSDTLANYQAVMRPATPDFTPGYGCLLSIDFEDVDATRAFFDNLSVHDSPHLGAHHTLAFPYNMLIYGAFPELAAYNRSFNMREEQIRISVGLEDEEELVDTFKAALAKAAEAKAKKAAGGTTN